MKIINLILVLVISLALNSCVEKDPSYSKMEVNKAFYFGEITLKDTVKHIYKLRNISEEPLRIKKIGTSCGCTGAILSDSIVKNGDFAEIQVTFIPNKNKIGAINNSIVIEANTTPPFTTLYLKGKVNE